MQQLPTIRHRCNHPDPRRRSSRGCRFNRSILQTRPAVRNNRFPLRSNLSDRAEVKRALTAGPPSPLNSTILLGPTALVPATVLITPLPASTRRIRLLVSSAMKRLPSLSTAMLSGVTNCAFSADPPSPARPRFPLPATLDIMPVPASMRRIKWLESQTKCRRCDPAPGSREP